MCKLLLIVVSISTAIFFGCNNSNEKSPDASVPQKTNEAVQAASVKIKAHVCNAACKDGGHAYLHNEIGHTCNSDCGKPHVCADKCKTGMHVYAHGETGHYCTCPVL